MSDLNSKAVAGLSWSAIDKIVSTTIVFVLGLIIARILDPSDYGVIGMLSIFMAISIALADSGFTDALIQKKEKSREDYSTVWIFNVFISSLLYIILFIAAPWIAGFFNTPILKSVTRVYTIQLVLNALFNVHTTKMRIDLRFKELAIVSMVSQLTMGLIGVWLAYNGWGVWALVFQSLSSSVIRGLLVIVFMKGWMPGMRFSKQSFNATFHFGSKLLILSLLDTVYANLYSLIIGKKYSASDVGFFNRGNQLATYPSSLAISVLVSVLFPVLSKLQDDDEKLLETYKGLISMPMFLLMPAIAGLGILAEPIVGILLKEKWLPCVPIMQIMCIGAMFSPILHTNRNLLYVKGRSDLVLKLELIRKPLGFAIIFISLPFGIKGLVAGKVIYEIIDYFISTYYTQRFFKYGWRKQLTDLLPTILGTAIMGAVVLFCKNLFSNWWMQLLIGVVSGVSSYVVIAILFKNPAWFKLLLQLKEKNRNTD